MKKYLRIASVATLSLFAIAISIGSAEPRGGGFGGHGGGGGFHAGGGFRAEFRAAAAAALFARSAADFPVWDMLAFPAADLQEAGR